MGAAMGFTPQQVGDMSAWQFLADVDGWVKAHSPDSDELSAKEVDELWDWISEG